MSSFEQRNAHFDRLFATQEPALARPEHQPSADASGGAQGAVRLDRGGGVSRLCPARRLHGLTQAIVDDLGLPHETTMALVTDGAVAALATVCRAYCEPRTNFVTTDPGWKWPMQFARQAGAEVREIPIYDPAVGYRLTPEKLGGKRRPEYAHHLSGRSQQSAGSLLHARRDQGILRQRPQGRRLHPA